MTKVTSKLQLTLPKAIAEQYGIRPGDYLRWIPAGDSIRIEPVRGAQKQNRQLSRDEKLAMFDRVTERLRSRRRTHARSNSKRSAGRGWTREELYERGLPR